MTEMRSPEEIFNDPALIAMAKGEVPLPDTTVKWGCPRCHQETSFAKTVEFFECAYCEIKIPAFTGEWKQAEPNKEIA